MNVKIFYRSATVWNIILFVFMMFLFLYFQEGLLQARTTFDLEFLKIVSVKYLPFVGLLAFCALSVFRLKTAAKPLFILCSAIAALITANHLLENFSKLITIALFLYILTSYYFYQFLKIEIDEAYYNPSYAEDDLFEPMLTWLGCEVEDLSTKKTYKAQLTNWNSNGCFVFFDEPLKKSKLRKVRLKTSLSSRPFESMGVVAAKASDGRGFGIKLQNKKEEDFGWKEFYSIIEQMGYNVELLR
ncbi:MAG: hypothetical protein WEB87_02860 [Bacteriovoracaceae bacterium]